MSKKLHPGFGLGGRFDRTLVETVRPSFVFGTDEYWMEQALLLSMNSVGLSQPNPSVGCVIVKDNLVMTSGNTQAFKSFHAERMAIQNLPEKMSLKGATAYVTLEPCSHFGSQPPCVDLFLNSGIKRVVIAALDPDTRVNGAGIQKLKDAGIELELGVLESEARLFHFPFMRTRLKKDPVWIGKWAQTKSGYVADAEGNSKWISNPQSRAYTHFLRQKYDAIVVGAETFLRDQPKLTVRDCAKPHHRDPEAFVFDPKGLILKSSSHPTSMRVFVCESVLGKAPPHWVIPMSETPDSEALMINFKNTLQALPFHRPLQSVMVEGGARLLNSFLEADLFDALHIFTGTREFNQTDERYRVRFQPQKNWFCAAQHKFEEDHLQEWVKGF